MRDRLIDIFWVKVDPFSADGEPMRRLMPSRLEEEEDSPLCLEDKLIQRGNRLRLEARFPTIIRHWLILVYAIITINLTARFVCGKLGVSHGWTTVIDGLTGLPLMPAYGVPLILLLFAIGLPRFGLPGVLDLSSPRLLGLSILCTTVGMLVDGPWPWSTIGRVLMITGAMGIYVFVPGPASNRGGQGK